MKTCHTPGTLRRYSKEPWRFQKTFRTPPNELESFVSAILSGRSPVDEGCVTIDKIVSQPRHLLALFYPNRPSPELDRDCSIMAVGREQIYRLLLATFSDWLNFLFVPQPKYFAVYADHDRFTTLFANTKYDLNGIIEPLVEKGFELVPDYKR